MVRSYAVAINWSMWISYLAQIDCIHYFLEVCTMITMIVVAVFDANVRVNHLMKQNILQKSIRTFVQGLRKKYLAATSFRIIITCAYITIRKGIVGPGDRAGIEGIAKVDGVVVAEKLVDVRRASTPVRIRTHHGRRQNRRRKLDGAEIEQPQWLAAEQLMPPAGMRVGGTTVVEY